MSNLSQHKKKNFISRSLQKKSIQNPTQEIELEFEQVYRNYYKRVLKFVQKYVTLQAPAEEITQDIFLKIFQNRTSYSKNYEFTSWIWSISRNTVFDYLRKIRSSLSRVKSMEELSDFNHTHPSSIQNAETLLIEHDEYTQIKEVISQLPAHQKEVLTLRVVHELSYEEIARKMNLSLSAVKSLLHRTKETLFFLVSEKASLQIALL
jgi:RNA polymerase sigma-70 factor, ECF subfamily